MRDSEILTALKDGASQRCLVKPTGDAEIDAISREAGRRAQVLLDALRQELPMVSCSCYHCGVSFRRMGLITFLCGRCEDEGHDGMPDACTVCAVNDIYPVPGSRHVTHTYGDPPGYHLSWAEQLMRKAG